MAPSRPLVIATHPVHADTVALLRRRCEVEVCERPPSPEVLATRAAAASALLAFMPDRVDARLLDACPELRIVAGAFKGADNVHVEACTARGVWVTVVPDLLSASTAELAVGLLNVGRGSTVDEEAVAAALSSGRLAGYAADVFAMEDHSQERTPAAIPPTLLNHCRSVFTPHLGSAVGEVRRAIEMRAAESILQALAGEPPEGAINAP
jgi:lactate dehydrogenase-like 2-hydroxyacid dehydrogenase